VPLVTCSDLINDAARACGKLGPGRTLSQSEQDDALRIFQRMMDGWTIARENVYSVNRAEYTLIPNQQMIAIGPVGDWIAPRPVNIDNICLLIQAGTMPVEVPLKVLDDNQWAGTRVKGITATLPTSVWYNGGWPNGELYFYPIPSEANKIVLYTWQQLSVPTSLDSIIRFPPGYEQAIVYSLAVRLCRPWGLNVAPDVAQLARESMAAIQSANLSSPRVGTSSGLRKGGGSFNWMSREIS